MRRFTFLMIGLCLVCGASWAQTVFYLNFDQAASTNNADATVYSPGGTEVSLPSAVGLGTATMTFRNNNAASPSGPSIGPAPGGMSGTAQGGNVLLVDSCAGQDEGLQIVVDNGLAPQDFTMEAVWFTTDPACAGNTANIQSIIGDEWPGGEVAQFFMRTVGADRMDYWTNRGDSNGEDVQITGAGTNAANTWYHDVLVFDYNNAAPASSTILAYRNGTLVASHGYDASGASVALFNASFTSQRRLAIGFGNQIEAGGFGDHRGLSGGVDAIAVTLGLLTPGSFVLPAGNPVPFTGPTPTPSPTPGPPELVKSGLYAAKVVNSGSWVSGADVGLDVWGNLVAVVPGNQMTLGFWIRDGRPEPSTLVRVSIAAFGDSSGGSWAGDTNFLSGAVISSQGFQQHVLDYTVPAGANFVNVGFRPEYGGHAVVVDDVSLVDVTAASGNLLPNGGFEDWPGGPNDNPTGWRFFDAVTTGGYVERVYEPPTNVRSSWEMFE